MTDMFRKGRGGPPVVQGENVGTAKLTGAIVFEMRAATGSQAEIATRFGVSQSTVSLVKSGKRWSHVK
jgi:predicted XRE-type DNA-binding protein